MGQVHRSAATRGAGADDDGVVIAQEISGVAGRGIISRDIAALGKIKQLARRSSKMFNLHGTLRKMTRFRSHSNHPSVTVPPSVFRDIRIQYFLAYATLGTVLPYASVFFRHAGFSDAMVGWAMAIWSLAAVASPVVVT